MGRIPEEDIARLKASVSLKGLFEARGVVLKREGKDGEYVEPYRHSLPIGRIDRPSRWTGSVR